MTMMRRMTRHLAAGAAAILMAGAAMAGPDDPSVFDPVRYEAQDVLYDWNYATPEEGIRALGFVRNHIAAMKEFGDFENSRIVIVAHGNDLHALARANAPAFPEAYEKFKELADQGVKIHICRNAARGRGYEPEDFYDFVTVVPAAVIDIAKYQMDGYTYMYAALFPSMKHEDVIAAHPELHMQ